MLKLTNISKKYNDRPILKNVNYTFENCSIYSITGENGAGKSTLLSIIAGILLADSGQINIAGKELTNNDLAYVPDLCPIYPFITGIEFLHFIQSIRKLPTSAYMPLVEAFGLQQHLNTAFKHLSYGTTKKFMLVSALMTQAKLILLDEPTNGLDESSVHVLQKILMIYKQDHLIIMACHDATVRHALQAIELDITTLQNES